MTNSWGRVSCFSILGAEVVTADGELRRVTPERDPDLYWAVRGGGVGFPGVVTRYHLKVYPRPRFIATAKYVFPATHIGGVVDWLKELAENDDLNKADFNLLSETHVCMVLATVYADSETEARGILGQLSRHPIAHKATQKSEFLPTNFETLLSGSPGGHQRYGLERRRQVCIWTDNLKEALVRIQELEAEVPGPTRRLRTIVVILNTRRDPLPDAAFSVQAEAIIYHTVSWDDAAEDAANLSWFRRVSAAIQPFAIGHYVNTAGVYGDPQELRGSFSPDAWERLQAVRKTYDPKGVFHDLLGRANS